MARAVGRAVVSVYTDTIRERVLTPQAVENAQRAAQLLRAAAPAVKEAMDLLAPVERAMDDTTTALYEAGHRTTDEESDAVRAGAYAEAIDLAFDILNEAQRISIIDA